MEVWPRRSLLPSLLELRKALRRLCDYPQLVSFHPKSPSFKRHMLSTRVLSSLLILSAVAPSVVRAQAAPESLAVHVDVCSQNLVDRRALQVELSTLGVEVIEDLSLIHI